MNALAKLPATLSLLAMASFASAFAQTHVPPTQHLSGRTHAEVLADYLKSLPTVASKGWSSESNWRPRTRGEVLADYDKAPPASKPDQGSLAVHVPHDRTPSQILLELDRGEQLAR